MLEWVSGAGFAELYSNVLPGFCSLRAEPVAIGHETSKEFSELAGPLRTDDPQLGPVPVSSEASNSRQAIRVAGQVLIEPRAWALVVFGGLGRRERHVYPKMVALKRRGNHVVPRPSIVDPSALGDQNRWALIRVCGQHDFGCDLSADPAGAVGDRPGTIRGHERDRTGTPVRARFRPQPTAIAGLTTPPPTGR